MKNLKLAFLLFFVLGMFYSNTAKSQATIERNTINISLKYGETTYTLTSGTEFIRITPSNNFIRTLTFKVDETNPIFDLPNPWAYFLGASYTLTINGETVELIGLAVITKGGMVKIRYISNGSGDIFSPGRFQ